MIDWIINGYHNDPLGLFLFLLAIVPASLYHISNFIEAIKKAQREKYNEAVRRKQDERIALSEWLAKVERERDKQLGIKFWDAF